MEESQRETLQKRMNTFTQQMNSINELFEKLSTQQNELNNSNELPMSNESNDLNENEFQEDVEEIQNDQLQEDFQEEMNENQNENSTIKKSNSSVKNWFKIFFIYYSLFFILCL